MNMQVSVRELKNHLSQYLQQVKAGKILIVTSHRTPLAQIQAVHVTKISKVEDLMHLEGVSWNGGKPEWPENRPKILGKMASDYVLEDRG